MDAKHPAEIGNVMEMPWSKPGSSGIWLPIASPDRGTNGRPHPPAAPPSTSSLADLVSRLAHLDYLAVAAWLLTTGCLGAAILDSYTSLCVVGGSLAHVGNKNYCPSFGGWDTRAFPLAVDMGWGGALCAVLRLARGTGLASWRWWTVVVFEVLTAAVTIAGNAFHGAVIEGAASHLGAWSLVLTCVASAVPGVVAVGSGFTLSVLISARNNEGRSVRPTDEATPPSNAMERLPDGEDEFPAGTTDQVVPQRKPASREGLKRARVRRLLLKERELLTTDHQDSRKARASLVQRVAKATSATDRYVRGIADEIGRDLTEEAD